MAFNPIAPVTGDPTKPKKKGVAPVTIKGATSGEDITLLKEGQDALLRNKYTVNPDEPYLGQYGSSYADKEGFETQGGNMASYKDGMVSFKKGAYNDVAQQDIIDRMRKYPENKGRELYLAGSTKKGYMAPSGYNGGRTTKTTKLNPVAPIK